MLRTTAGRRWTGDVARCPATASAADGPLGRVAWTAAPVTRTVERAAAAVTKTVKRTVEDTAAPLRETVQRRRHRRRRRQGRCRRPRADAAAWNLAFAGVADGR